MSELFTKLSGDQILGLFGIGLGCVAVLGGIAVAITQVVATNRRRSQRDEIEATLKMEMIDRGMSAGDIKQVLEARVGSSRSPLLQEIVDKWPAFCAERRFKQKEAARGA